MSIQKSIVILFINLAFATMILAFSFENSFSAPCRPCQTWNEIKSCWSDNPAPCCSCGKGGNIFRFFIWVKANFYRQGFYCEIKRYMDNFLHSTTIFHPANNTVKSCDCESVDDNKK